ncbi:tumor necrosis factor receptor superfamily member 17-like [Puntigrus tetrazona]|uniref:tumor necrosis factor receptor superfamily member 17-like n=1 Tax=Puntigrus tetrazona TaxID=1606681 RepID=UPI001C8AB3CD|nr:tumor necrosis factor receptor superfamily member 17-like [Puntigrus tetrazona]
MNRRPCSSGYKWDSLIKFCVSQSSGPLTPAAVSPPVPKPVMSNRDQPESWSSISPSTWICVGMVTSNSVLVLLLWFIIYRRHSRTSQSTGEKDSAPHTLITIEQEEKALSPLPRVNGQRQEVPIDEGPCGRSLCNGGAEHGLPLPATELGYSALVTTKTGQPV